MTSIHRIHPSKTKSPRCSCHWLPSLPEVPSVPIWWWHPAREKYQTFAFLPLVAAIANMLSLSRISLAFVKQNQKLQPHYLAQFIHGSMAPWLGPSSLGWEPQFPVSSSKSSLYLKSKMIEIQKWKWIVGGSSSNPMIRKNKPLQRLIWK